MNERVLVTLGQREDDRPCRRKKPPQVKTLVTSDSSIEGFPHPSEIAAAMSPSLSKGYLASFSRITSRNAKSRISTDEIAEGTVTFNAPKLHRISNIRSPKARRDMADRKIPSALAHGGLVGNVQSQEHQ